MRYAVILAGLALAACDRAPAPAPAPTTLAFAPTSITLPEETSAFPDTPAGTTLARCAACHSADMVLRQPRLSATQWAATVRKMREVYRAPYTAAEDAGLVAALVDLQSASQP